MYCFRSSNFCQHVYSAWNIRESIFTNSCNGHSRFHLISKLSKLVCTQIRCVIRIYKGRRTSSFRLQLQGTKVLLLNPWIRRGWSWRQQVTTGALCFCHNTWRHIPAELLPYGLQNLQFSVWFCILFPCAVDKTKENRSRIFYIFLFTKLIKTKHSQPDRL